MGYEDLLLKAAVCACHFWLRQWRLKTDCYNRFHLFLSKNLFYSQFTNVYISGYRFDIVHEESIEFQNFNLRNNVCQLCVFKVNLLCLSLIVSFFGGCLWNRDNIVQCSDVMLNLLEASVSFSLSNLFLWHFQYAYYFNKLL